MTAPPTSSQRIPGRAEQAATRLVFLVSGLAMSAWAPLVPYAKARTHIDEGSLGILLLCLGTGSVLAMPLAGVLTARTGCQKVIITSVVTMLVALPLLAALSSLPLLMLGLLLFGAGLGALDVSMNIQAIIVERASGRAMMPGFHGLFSLGGMLGAAGVTALLSSGVAPLPAVSVLVIACLVCLALSFRGLLPYGSQSEGPLFALPHGIVLLIGAVCFVVFMAEGAVLDWSAVSLTSTYGIEAAMAGYGYAAFSLAMTVCRLAGDRLVQRVGNQRIVLFGGIAAATGIFLATRGPSWEMALVGYALVGFGCSNIVPVMFSAAGRQTVMPANVAVPAITTLGYAGILAGPAAIGFVTHVASLPAAFLGMAALLVGVAMSARWLRV